MNSGRVDEALWPPRSSSFTWHLQPYRLTSWEWQSKARLPNTSSGLKESVSRVTSVSASSATWFFFHDVKGSSSIVFSVSMDHSWNIKKPFRTQRLSLSDGRLPWWSLEACDLDSLNGFLSINEWEKMWRLIVDEINNNLTASRQW